VPSSIAVDGLGDASQLHAIQFGDSSWSLHRQSVTGDKRAAIKQLREACHEAIVSSQVTTAAPTEDQSLAFLVGSTCLDQEPGKWQLYELQKIFPMVVGVARPLTSTSKAVTDLADYRMVVWGLAVPTGDAQWTLSTFQSRVSASGGVGPSDVPVPPGACRTLSLSAATGRIVTLSGPDRPAEWKRFYDDWFARQGGPQPASWRMIDGAWYARFTDRDALVDLHFSPDGHGALTGLLMMTPRESRER
jgi:hypothetical protein